MMVTVAFADRQGPAEHIGPAAEAAQPVAVADDGVVGVAPIRVGRENAARRSTDPQDLKEALDTRRPRASSTPYRRRAPARC